MDTTVAERTLARVADTIRRLPPVRGRGALAQRIRHWFEGPATGAWRIALPPGVVVEVPRASEQGWVPAFTGRYEPHIMHIADRLFLPETFCIDVGACFGLFALPLGAMARRRRGAVVAFEPVPENVRWLRHNVTINGLESVTDVHPVGLSNEATEANMRKEQEGGGNAVVMRTSPDGHSAPVTRVGLVRLDDLALASEARGLPCSFVKMDVEGHELFALQGAEDFLARHRPAIVGEFNSKFMAEHGLGARDILAWSKGHGYVVHRIARRRRWRIHEAVHPRLLEPRLDGGEPWGDLLLMPEERRGELAEG